jgi:8-oxo-dGTP diphosphatase
MNAQHNVAAGILICGQRVLLCQRKRDLAWYPGVWDLVGGHIEAAETPLAALRRECREELGIDIGEPSDELKILLPHVNLRIFVIRSWTGEPVNAAPNEHETIGWYTASEIDSLCLSDEKLAPLLKKILSEQH